MYAGVRVNRGRDMPFSPVGRSDGRLRFTPFLFNYNIGPIQTPTSARVPSSTYFSFRIAVSCNFRCHELSGHPPHRLQRNMAPGVGGVLIQVTKQLHRIKRSQILFSHRFLQPVFFTIHPYRPIPYFDTVSEATGIPSLLPASAYLTSPCSPPSPTPESDVYDHCFHQMVSYSP